MKLKLHFEEVHTEGGDDAGATDELKDALRRMKDAIEDAVGAAGAAAKDPAVKADLKDVGRSLSDALAATFDEAGDEVRKVFGRDNES
jgi:hypothetical protein